MKIYKFIKPEIRIIRDRIVRIRELGQVAGFKTKKNASAENKYFGNITFEMWIRRLDQIRLLDSL